MDFKTAAWRYLLADGGIHNVYGGYEAYGTEYKQLQHVKACGLDLDKASDVDFGTVEQFTDTFSDNDKIPAVVGLARCTCGDVKGLLVSVVGPTLGDVITKIVETGK